MHEQNTPKGGATYEERDINIRSVGIFGVVLLLVIGGAAYLITLWMFQSAAGVEPGPPPTPLLELQSPPPPPVLQARPETDLQRVRQREEDRLRSYGWVDRDARLVHLPIERAMELVEEQGRRAVSTGASDALKE